MTSRAAVLFRQAAASPVNGPPAEGEGDDGVDGEGDGDLDREGDGEGDFEGVGVGGGGGGSAGETAAGAVDLPVATALIDALFAALAVDAPAGDVPCDAGGVAAHAEFTRSSAGCTSATTVTTLKTGSAYARQPYWAMKCRTRR